MIYTFNVTKTAHVSSYAIKLYYCNSITKIMRAPSRCDLSLKVHILIYYLASERFLGTYYNIIYVRV